MVVQLADQKISSKVWGSDVNGASLRHSQPTTRHLDNDSPASAIAACMQAPVVGHVSHAANVDIVTVARAGGEPLRYALRVAGILVIEDDPINQMILVDYLAANGYHMHVAATAAEGLAMCAHVEPSLVLLDVQLPGKNGFDVCREIKRLNPKRLVLMMSAAYSQHDQFERNGQLGGLADGYLAKPFDLKRLLADVVRLLGQPSNGSV